MSIQVRKRIGLPKGWFHVMNRGARKVSIFADEDDRGIFRGLLGRFAEKYSVRILAWCLMPNHYHLQPECEGTPLSNMMRDLDGTYARIFNTRHGTTGCLFQGPFKSMLIRDPEGLVYVNRYIHLNPLDIGQSPSAYKWSSCSAYLGIASAPSWMDLEPVQKCIRVSERSDAESYAFYLNQRRRRKVKRRQDPVGNFYTEWIRHLEERVLEKQLRQEEVLGKFSIQPIVAWIAQRAYGVPAEIIAKFFGYGSAGAVRVASTRVQQRIVDDPCFAQAMETLINSAPRAHQRPGS